jgi:Zn-dependent M28 family amino/carboxypeptidase
VQQLIADELAAQGWEVERQSFDYRGVELTNLIGRYPSNIGSGPIVLMAAHYDTRARADADLPELHDQPVPGAIDGGSGVAVLLELARVLDVAATGKEVWLVFFDGEDNGSGGLPEWDWIVGSRYMAENLTVEPEALVLIDLVGQVDQQFYYEGNSDRALQAEIWTLAAALGFGDDFVPQLKYTMIDDHVPFVERGITAIDIIDFDYPWWHTTHDTLDKASADSLYRIGRLLQVWLEGRDN